MTLDEAKDYIAYRMRTSWEEIQKTHTTTGMEAVMNEVCDVYARSKWYEACFESAKLNRNTTTYIEPEFKP